MFIKFTQFQPDGYIAHHEAVFIDASLTTSPIIYSEVHSSFTVHFSEGLSESGCGWNEERGDSLPIPILKPVRLHTPSFSRQKSVDLQLALVVEA
jgi:hypothetical protein